MSIELRKIKDKKLIITNITKDYRGIVLTTKIPKENSVVEHVLSKPETLNFISRFLDQTKEAQ